MANRQQVKRSTKARLTRRQLATLLAVHMQSVTKWEREGLPIAERGRRGKPSRYRLRDVQAWLKARDAGAQTSTTFQEYQRAHARQRAALAELAELDLAERRGQLVELAKVESTWLGIITRARNKLLGLPHKLKSRRPDVGRDVVVLVDELIREALEELAASQAPKEASA